MKLVRLARDNWDVLTVLDVRDRCEVLEFLFTPGESYRIAAMAMLHLLFEVIPKNGPPTSEPLCKSLGNSLYELRKQPKGKKLRVVWFYGGGSVIVCTSAFTKAERTPQNQLSHAAALREWYFASKARDRIKIVELKETRWPRPMF